MTAFVHYNDLVAGTAPPAGEDTVIWVPGEFIACHRVTVPPVSGKKWRAMIPWLLEDQLLEPPEQLVFRTGKKDGDGSVPVVAVGRGRLESWRREIAAAGFDYSALVPDFFALPWAEGQISLAFDEDDRCLVRFNHWQGAAGTAAFIESLVKTRLRTTPATVVVYHQGELPEVTIPGAEAPRFQRVQGLFTPDHESWLGIDEGQTSTSRARWSLPAKVASVLVFLLLALYTASTVVETRRIADQAAHFQNQLRQGYRQYFGEDYDFAMADFQRVVSSRLEASAGEASGSIAMVSSLSRLLEGCSECRLQELQVKPDRMTARIMGEGAGEQLASAVTGDNRLSLSKADDHWLLTLTRGDL